MTTERRRAHALVLGLLGRAAGFGPPVVPDEPETVWQKAVLLAADGFLAPALGAAVARLGVTPPGGTRPALALLRARNAKRNEGLRAALLDTARALNEIGVEPVLLKGAIRLVDDLYPDASWRFLQDLDLLVPPDRAEEAHDHLVRRGFRPDVVDVFIPDDAHHLVPLTHPTTRITVELHTALALEHTAPVLDPAAMAGRAEPASIDGARLRLPRPADQLVHLVAHVQFRHGAHAAARLVARDLLEAALLLRRHRDEDLATALTSAFADVGRARVAATYLALLDRYLPDGATVSTPPASPPLTVRCLLAWTELNLRSAWSEAASETIGFCRVHLERFRGSGDARARFLRGLSDGAYWRARYNNLALLTRSMARRMNRS